MLPLVLEELVEVYPFQRGLQRQLSSERRQVSLERVLLDLTPAHPEECPTREPVQQEPVQQEPVQGEVVQQVRQVQPIR